MKNFLEKSPNIAKLIKDKKIEVHAAYYNLKTGIVEIINKGIYFMDDEKEKVQKLITHYEHLKYFSCINSEKWIEFTEPLKKQL